jgi:hypothetical protein
MEPTRQRRHIRMADHSNPTVRTRLKPRCVMKRRRSPPHTFLGNIAAEKAKLEAELANLKPGPQMDAIRKKLRQLDTAAHISGWLTSPGLQPPKPA